MMSRYSGPPMTLGNTAAGPCTAHGVAPRLSPSGRARPRSEMAERPSPGKVDTGLYGFCLGLFGRNRRHDEGARRFEICICAGEHSNYILVGDI
jgi:hypothetical protein